MDSNKEYHDPDYPEAPVSVKEEAPALTEEEKINKIKQIIRQEFTNEIDTRENEVMIIDQRLSTSRRLLQRLRYTIVNRYFNDQKLQITNTQIQDEIAMQKDPKARAEVSSILRDSQRQIHPSVRKLIGKDTVTVDEIFTGRTPRNKKRKDYSAMLKSSNFTISADSTKSLRPKSDNPPSPEASAPPRKIPRQIDPKITNVVTIDEATRNQMKYRYRIIIGNTSKYVPATSASDRSTHKWLLYVRALPPRGPAPSAVTVQLHHSYAPHHVVHLDKPPYHISRRGWGEFPARVTLHFPLPDRNKPATLEHHIKLDRNYTGMQMLGSETVVDVWLYSTPEMIQYSYKEDDTQPEPIKQDEQTNTTDWMDFFKSTTELDIDEMLIKPNKNNTAIDSDEMLIKPIKNDTAIDSLVKPEISNNIKMPEVTKPLQTNKRIVKYIDPTTGKIYYLEMDRELDLTKVQEIVINNTSTKVSPVLNGTKKKAQKGVSLVKPLDLKPSLLHIENDHCYIARFEVKQEACLYKNLCSKVCRFSDVRSAVNYLVKHIPLISSEVRDSDFVKCFPFVVENSDKYWKLDFAKRRNIEWSRAKLINRILNENFTHAPIWRTKQILTYLRLHGHYPIRNDTTPQKNDDFTWNYIENSIKQLYPQASDINTLTAFKFDIDSSLNDTIELSDEDVDVLSCDVNIKVKKEVLNESESSLSVLPVDNEDDRLRFMYIEKKCADIGIELRNEDVGNGYSYSAVHAVLLSAMKCFAEEMIRNAIAAKRLQEDPGAATRVWLGSSSTASTIQLSEMFSGCSRGRLHCVTARGLAHTDTV